MRIHYFAGEAWEADYIRGKLAGHDVVFHEGPFSAHADLSDPHADVLCIFVESKITASDLDRFPNVKLIATRSTGFDHIDLAAAKERGITVATVPFYGENTVAEFALGLILALSRRIVEADRRVRATGLFDQHDLRGFDLAGKTLGIVGTGHIGAHVIRMAKGCGMEVVGFDAFPNESLANTLGFRYVPLPELLATSDIVTLHVPYNEHTHHLINSGNIGSFKKGAYLVNTARGAVVETGALVQALQDGTLAGAGLDVLEQEGSLTDESEEMTKENRYLIDHPRVIVTPHVAFNTTEAVKRILDTTIDNIRNFAAGTPSNVV